MRVVITNEKPGLRDLYRQTALGVGLECDPEDCVPYDDLAVRLAQGRVDLVLVVTGSQPAAAAPVIEQAAAQVPVLATGPYRTPESIMQAIRSGAREYLNESRLREELTAALDKLWQTKAVGYRRGRVLAIMAASPGSGVTTVAANLAFALGDKYPGRVALAEVGAGVPELALSLDLTPRHSVTEVAQNWDRLDVSMLGQMLVPHAAGVQVLAHQPETLLAAPLQPQAMRQALLLLGTMFDFTVLDLGSATDAACREALALSDPVLVVMRMDVPSIRLTRRFIQHLTELNTPPGKICVVANRYGQRKQLTWKQAEEALGLPILQGIPDDPKRLNQALNSGAPLICTARRAGITRSFAKLAARFNGQGN
jgi:pilus assembly protein CpaE